MWASDFAQDWPSLTLQSPFLTCPNRAVRSNMTVGHKSRPSEVSALLVVAGVESMPSDPPYRLGRVQPAAESIGAPNQWMTNVASMSSILLSEIESTTEAALRAHGASETAARKVAHAVRTAEANNNRICGLYYVESYCRQLETGRVLGDVDPAVTTDRPGAVRVDARYGFAQVAFAAGFDAAIEAATTNGTCALSIEHSHTCTSLGYFTEQFATAGFVALGATNSTARVSPPGGSIKMLGTNPMAMAVPARGGGVAFQFDFSTSAVALGKITMAAAAGESIPLGWAIDADGNDTTDPHAALEGSLVSAGGYKGFGLGLMVEVLAGAMTGSLLSTEIPPLKAHDGPHHDIGQFYLVMDPSAFAGDGFYDRLDAIASMVDAQPGARLPGSVRSDLEAVEVDDALWATISGLAS